MRTAWLKSFGAILFLSQQVCAANEHLAQKEVLQYRTDTQSFLIPNDEIPTAALPQETAKLARITELERREKALWRLLKTQRLTELRNAMARTRSEYPEWRAPKQLLREFKRQRQTALIQRATKAKDWHKVIALSKKMPQHFNCKEVYHLWGLADAYFALKQAAQTWTIYQRIISQCASANNRLVTLQRAALQLNEAELAMLIDQESRRNQPQPVGKQFAKFRYGFILKSASNAYEEGQYRMALMHLRNLETEIIESRDAAAASLLAWSLNKQERNNEAIIWLERATLWSPMPEYRYALALAYYQADDLSWAKVLAQEAAADNESRAALLLRDIHILEADRAYQQGDYRQTIDALNQACLYGEIGRENELLTAWSYYQLDEQRIAAARFAALYRHTPDRDSARGVVFSHLKLNELQSAYALVEEVPGPLASLLSRDTVDPLLASGYTLDSLPLNIAESGTVTVDIESLDVSSVTPWWMYRYKSGEPGLSRLEISKFPIVNLRYLADASNEWQLQVERVNLASGKLDHDAPVGSFPANSTPVIEMPTVQLDNGFEGLLRYRHRGTQTVFGEIGFTPTAGEVSSTLQIKLGFTQPLATRGWQAMLFRSPVRESLLSYTGLRDPFTGETWGRILKFGGRGAAYHTISDHWTLASSVELARLEGKNVNSNRKAELYVTLSRNFKHEAFDTLAIGPFTLLQSYHNNQNHFTYGNGGYYSPQRLAVLGVSARFQTKQRAHQIVQGSGSIGLLKAHQEASAFFPLTPDERNFAAQDQTGLNLHLQLEGVKQIGSSPWQAVGMLQGQISPQYNEFSTFLGLRYLIGQRRLALHQDIPEEVVGTLR